MDDIPVFSISPNPAAMYLTPPLKEGVVRFKRAIQRKQGLCAILGDVGYGKSTLLRHLSTNYEMDDAFTVSYLHDSRKCKTPFDFLKILSVDFGVPFKRSQIAQMDAIEEFLFENFQNGKTTIAFIDEAQRLPLETLELIRSLLNYETETYKMLQVVVAGQLSLRDKLLKRQYQALRSRIVAPLLMQPLTQEQTESMITTRLESWGVPETPFTQEAIQEIHLLAGGVPRQILLLCQHACDLVGMVDGETLSRKVGPADITAAFRTLEIADQIPEQEEAFADAV